MANWFFLVFMSVLSLTIYSMTILRDEQVTLHRRSNSSKVLEVCFLTTGVLIFLIIDFHFCHVVSWHTKHLRSL